MYFQFLHISHRNINILGKVSFTVHLSSKYMKFNIKIRSIARQKDVKLVFMESTDCSAEKRFLFPLQTTRYLLPKHFPDGKNEQHLIESSSPLQKLSSFNLEQVYIFPTVEWNFNQENFALINVTRVSIVRVSNIQ